MFYSKNVSIFASEFDKIMTYNEAQSYVKSPKRVIDNQGKMLDKLNLKLTPRQRFRIDFADEDSNKYVLDVFQSERIGVKMSFNLRNETNEGLVRLDYNGNHTNPSPYTSDVPEVFKPYEGWLFNAESHLHLYVENHGLDWALPIEETEIDPKNIDATDPDQGFFDAFKGFCRYLNVETEIELQIK